MKIIHIIKVFLPFQLSALVCLGHGNDAHALSQPKIVHVYAKDGDTVDLECKQQTGGTLWQGPANLTTYTSGSAINPSLKSYKRLAVEINEKYFNLTIKDVSKEDEGLYKCSTGAVDMFFELRVQRKMDDIHLSTAQVTNDFGVSSVSDNMEPKGKLISPENLTTVYAKENEIRVTWQSVKNGVKPLSFIVEYRPKGQDTWNSLWAGEQNVVINGLQPETEYYLRVFSVHGNRTSGASNVIIIVTESSANHGVYAIVSLLFVGLAVAIVVFVVYFVFGKAMGAVQNNFYDMQNNTPSSAAARNADLPVYSSIDRRLNLNHVKQNVSYNVSQNKRKAKSDHVLRKPKLESTTKQTESSFAEPYKTGNNELCYTEVCFEPTQDSCRIRTRESKSPYADIDLSKTAQRLPSDDEEETGDEDFADIEDVKKMKRKTVIK